jgi:regulation of enolase protein 1 (concanavalin A-like superfamily)
MTLSNLTPGTFYHFLVSSIDSEGNVAVSEDFTFRTSGGQDLSGIMSDDFSSAQLNTSVWSFVNPVGDGIFNLTGTQLELVVPAGTNHDVWTAGNRSVRIMQPALDEDLETEVKFESEPTQRFQMQGLLVEQDADNFLRLDFYSDGSALWVFAARFVGGVPTTLINQPIASSSELYLRLTRQGDTWTPQYSDDGVSWNPLGSFTHALNVSAVGVFAGNTGGNPAHTAVVDYFFNTFAPIVPEDGTAQ